MNLGTFSPGVARGFIAEPFQGSCARSGLRTCAVFGCVDAYQSVDEGVKIVFFDVISSPLFGLEISSDT